MRVRLILKVAGCIFAILVAVSVASRLDPTPTPESRIAKPTDETAKLVADGRVRGIEYGEVVRVFVDPSRIDHDALQTVYAAVGAFEVCDDAGETLGRFDGVLIPPE